MERYEVDSLGNQIYPRSEFGGEKYLKDGKFDVMAKKRDSRGNFYPYFAKDREGNPICPFLKENMKYLELKIHYPKRGEKEIYPKRDNKEFYIGQNEVCTYARDEAGNEYYAQSPNGYYYAFKRNQNGDLIDFPLNNEQGVPQYIMAKDGFLYPVNWTKRRIIYPVDSDGNECYLENGGIQYYGYFQTDTSSSAFPIYAKNKLGDDILAIRVRYPYYAFSIDQNRKKKEYYPKMKNGTKQFYLRIGRREFYAKFGKNEFYAKDGNSEYFATDHNSTYYAIDGAENEFYPSTSLGKNIYRVEENIERIAENLKTKKGFYAKDEFKNEFYPKIYSAL